MRTGVAAMALFSTLALAGCRMAVNRPTAFQIEEATIAEIHAAMRQGRLTSRQLVEDYLRRIAQYDQSTDLNAIIMVNPRAREEADRLDREYRSTGKLRPLHGIPLIIKDNLDTADMPTTGGSIALKDTFPLDDASVVKKLRQAGAILLAKSNMDEWAFSPYKTESSIAGVTRNPYDLSRVPAGSSGGTAAAVAANFGLAGIGTDTGNSIRGPSSHCALVGIRPTLGLTSRDGIIPLYLDFDVAGPMARTVEDAARLLDTMAGYDPADPVTAACVGKIPKSYTAFLDDNGLSGARIGVLRPIFETQTTDAQIKRLMEQAITDLRRLGATIVDPCDCPLEATMELPARRGYRSFQYYLNRYLATRGERVPYRTLAEIVASGKYHPALESRLRRELEVPPPARDEAPAPTGVAGDPARESFRDAIVAAMDAQALDALVYPTWSNAPRLVGDLESPHGDNNQVLSPLTGLPALTVPMGYTYERLPAGLQFLGRPFDEGRLVRLAYAYEQATRHRRPPRDFSLRSK